MAESTTTSCLQIFFADMQTHGVWPMLYQKQGDEFRHLSKPETVAQIRETTKALRAIGITVRTPVAFQGAPSLELWVGEWGVLACRGIAVIVPRDFSVQELVDTLAESKSKLVFVDNLEDAHTIARASDKLLYLTHIVCFEGSAEDRLPIWSWKDFLESGRTQPDHLTALLNSIEPQERAILFHYKDENGERRAASYTQALLLEHARKMDVLLAHQTVAERTAVEVKYKEKGMWHKLTSYAQTIKEDKAYIRNLDAVLAAVSWAHIAGHIMGYYVPVLKGATVQIADNMAAISLPEYRPHVIIGEAEYLDRVREYVTQNVRKSGALQWKIFVKILALGKRKYETTGKLNVLQRMQEAILGKMINSHILKLLGGRLRLIIGVDDAAHYETQIFFNSFGIGFVELPSSLLQRD